MLQVMPDAKTLPPGPADAAALDFAQRIRSSEEQRRQRGQGSGLLRLLAEANAALSSRGSR